MNKIYYVLVASVLVHISNIEHIHAKDKAASKTWSNYFLAAGKVATASVLAPALVISGAMIANTAINATRVEDTARVSAMTIVYTASIIATFDLYTHATKNLHKSISKKRPLSRACSLVASTLIGGIFGAYCASYLPN